MSEKKEDFIQVKISDEALRGLYANAMQLLHTKEEFILDFMNVLPPRGEVLSRIVVSPGHMKRITSALVDNLKKYENNFGDIQESQTVSKLELEE